MIEIIPAIDIIDGHCVRLTKGDYSQRRVYDSAPEEMARQFLDHGLKRIHVVDLDGAKSETSQNLRKLELIARTGLEVEWGGGIKSSETLSSVFSAGATYAIIGSVAALKPELFTEWLKQYGGGKLIFGADLRDGRVAVNGWKEEVNILLETLLDAFIPMGLEQVICTDISRDGMLEGPATELYLDLQRRFSGLCFTVSGGISNMSDILKLNELGLRRVIVGKAIYEGKISLKEISEWLQKG